MAHRFSVGMGAGHHILDPWSQGVGIMRDVCSRWSELDITQIGSLIAIAGTLPTAWTFLKRAWHHASGYVQRFFLASVIIPGSDPLNRSVVKWVLTNRPRHHRAFTGLTDVRRSHGDRAAALKKTRHPVDYLPHWRSRWILYQGRLFVVSRKVFDFTSLLSDPSYDGIGGEDLTVSTFGWSAAPIMRFVETCREFMDRQTQFFVIIYARDRYGLAWKPKARQPIRHLDTVHLEPGLKGELLTDIRNYLDSKTQKRYQSRSMPYRRGYLFYGPPGTGKSSSPLPSPASSASTSTRSKSPASPRTLTLSKCSTRSPRCIVLLEDVDAVWTDRAAPERRTPSRDGTSTPTSNCTLSGLLNVLDGVSSQEGRIVIMTTNRPEALDSALVRPGRVDMKVRLGNIGRPAATEMFLRMFSPDLGCAPLAGPDEMNALAARFAEEIPDDAVTPSQLQGFFQMHLDSPQDAAASIASWVRREIGVDSDKEFEVVVNGDGHYKAKLNGTAHVNGLV
ncbi:unnamed protein product [Parascedosporium putredinis]|uniref:BCS1 N-terminal domain-containing protein n=1 Tax=Parascedosporium putredinis TaxID=1442378 RepID=A0A9P1M8C3_9PEZI|nr:unnamed protein product [Parascedosporium putredinis]CAI7992356.1 unnamed protein product [Parascedosporium putredinis]